MGVLGGSLGWLQPAISPAARETDGLYALILWILVALFLVTQGGLLASVIFFREKKGRKVSVVHENLTVEVVWTLIPSLILLLLAMLSGGMWSRMKLAMPAEGKSLVVQVFAQQFVWNFRYAGADGKFGTADDVTTLNQLHVPLGRPVSLRFSSQDVVHSFFFPEARVKADTVPGMLTFAWLVADKTCVWDRKAGRRRYVAQEEFDRLPVALDGLELKAEKISLNGLRRYWYQPAEPGGRSSVVERGLVSSRTADEAEFVLDPMEIACAQLCGNLHYSMRGSVTVEPPALFDAWLARAPRNQEAGKHAWELWDRWHKDFN
jgi:heme/copper-type cytochrome/quinol oxidase subunit 2